LRRVNQTSRFSASEAFFDRRSFSEVGSEGGLRLNNYEILNIYSFGKNTLFCIFAGQFIKRILSAENIRRKNVR